MSEKEKAIVAKSPVREAGLRKQDATEGESGNPNRAGSAAGSRTPNPALKRTEGEMVWNTAYAQDDETAIACISAALAAAEERGRRAGIEERDKLRARLWEALAVIESRAPDMTLLIPRIKADLAPRDSGKGEHG